MITYDDATLLIYTNSPKKKTKLCESLSNELLSFFLSLFCCVLRVYLSPLSPSLSLPVNRDLAQSPQLGILTRLLAFGLAFCGAPVYCTCQLNGIVNATQWIFFLSSSPLFFFCALILFSFFFIYFLSFLLYWNHFSLCSVGVST